MKWVIAGLLGWLLYSSAQNPLGDADDPASVPWDVVAATNYRAACVDYVEPRNMGERVVPGLDELDQWGDANDTYSAATTPAAGARAFILPCSSPPPERLR